MINKTVDLLALTFLCIVPQLVLGTMTSEEQEAIEFLNETNENFSASIQILKSSIIEGHMKGPLSDLKNQLLDFSFPDVNKLKIFNYDTFENENVKRALKILSNRGLMVLGLSGYVNVTSTLNSIADYLKDHPVCLYDISDCPEASIALMRGKSYISNSPEKLKYYWKSGRNASDGVPAIVNMKYVVDQYRNASKRNGHQNNSETWYYDYEDSNFIYELEDVIRQLRPLYVQLHSFIRFALRQKYTTLVPENGPIPEHFLREVIYRASAKDLDQLLPYPEYNPFFLDTVLMRRNSTFIENVRIADDFFISMGMMDLTQSYWRNHRRIRRNPRSTKRCTTEFYDFDADLAIVFCAKSDFESFLQSHGDMAIIQYSRQRNKLIVGLNKQACPGFSNALAQATMLSAMNIEYLQKVGIPNDKMRLNLLFYMSIQTLFPLLENFVQEKLWVRILEGKLKPEEYNCYYWSLMKDYAGIEPPEYRTNVHFDVAEDFFDILGDNPPNARIFGKIFGHQLFYEICKQTQENDKTLQQCKWEGNTEVGKILSEIMSTGAQKSWRDILHQISRKKQLSASGLLEFYEPLRVWLVRQNRNNRVFRGWRAFLKCDHVTPFYDENVFE